MDDRDGEGSEREQPPWGDRWSLDELTGRLTELSGVARLTLACSLVLEAQRSMIPAVWISATSHTFFPPDMERGGVDLEELPVVLVPDAASAGRAADWLVRSDAFGLVLVDLEADPCLGPARTPAPAMGLSMALQARLAHLARRSSTAVVFLTRKETVAPSMSSMITLRGETLRSAEGPFRYACEVRILKDKRRGPGWRHREVFDGPPGLH